VRHGLAPLSEEESREEQHQLAARSRQAD